MIIYRVFKDNGGFTDYDTPPDGVDYVEIDTTPTPEELQAVEQSKKTDAINNVYSLVEKLELSALKRCINKDLPLHQLNRLKATYDMKYKVALEVLADAPTTNQAMYNVINNEKELEDFVGQNLYNTIAHLNATFNAEITPLENRLKDFCQIIKWKYESNSYVYNDFLTKIEAMRTVLITDVEFSNSAKFDQRLIIIEEVLNSNLSFEDIQIKYNQFLAV